MEEVPDLPSTEAFRFSYADRALRQLYFLRPFLLFYELILPARLGAGFKKRWGTPGYHTVLDEHGLLIGRPAPSGWLSKASDGSKADGAGAGAADDRQRALHNATHEMNGVEWSPSAGEKLCLQPLLAPYHSDGSPEQELSRSNPASLLKVIELRQLDFLAIPLMRLV